MTGVKSRQSSKSPGARGKPIAVAIIVLGIVAGITFAVLMRKNAPPVDSSVKAAVVADPQKEFSPTVANPAAAPGTAPEGMAWIPGGEFSMGAVDPLGQDANIVGMQATKDSRPIHRVAVKGFWIDKTEVTNAQFAAFVKATTYVTVAERKPTAEEFPGAPPENWWPARWSLHRRIILCRSTIISSGGRGSRARTGNIRRDRDRT
jgi:formylglycine-generating enzyme required for sulfatase activity